MKCPVCKTINLNPITLESLLSAHVCIGCQGIWISSNDYLAWLAEHGPNLPEKTADEAIPFEDVSQAKVCPECGHILRRYKIGHGIAFVLDHCSHCNGVWLDKNEWEVLKSRNLHDDLNLMFTNVWQEQVQKSERRQFFQKLYAQKFGTADYAEIRRTRDWLDHHPKRMELLAYLTDQDPYQ